MLLSLLEDSPGLQFYEWRSLQSSHPQLLFDCNFLVWLQPRLSPSVPSYSQCSRVVGAGSSHQELGSVWSIPLTYQYTLASLSMWVPVSMFLGSVRKPILVCPDLFESVFELYPWFLLTHLLFCLTWRDSRKMFMKQMPRNHADLRGK